VNDDYLDARHYLYAYSHYVLPIMWYMVPWTVVAVVYTLLVWQVSSIKNIIFSLIPILHLLMN
jgi:membrane protein required for beta-lactamase induction